MQRCHAEDVDKPEKNNPDFEIVGPLEALLRAENNKPRASAATPSTSKDRTRRAIR